MRNSKHKLREGMMMNFDENKNKILSFGLCLVLLSGCVSLKEMSKRVLGTSVVHLERVRDKGESKTFNLTASKCYEIVKAVIFQMNGKVYVEDGDKKHLAAMYFKGHVDTTQVGVFFTSLSGQQTKVEVASLSSTLVEEVSERIFTELGKS